jgi:hypothetical protein
LKANDFQRPVIKMTNVTADPHSSCKLLVESTNAYEHS